jgi:phytoene dehydrogenase-like protein
MAKKVLIIGGGMAGLSAGAYLQMNGFDTEIFEMHEVPGGVCTAWKRGDYTVDWCIHWLIGSGPADSFYERWNELMDMERLEIVDHEEYAVIEDLEGRRLHLYTNLDRLQAEMLKKAPEDSAKIDEFILACRKLTHFELPNDQAFEVANLWYKLKWFFKVMPFLGTLGKFSKISTEDYARGFSNPLLRKAMHNLFEPEVPILFCMMTFAWMHKKAAGYPLGGSLNFAGRAAERFSALGGKIHYHSKVDKILVENDRAMGLQLDSGERHLGDYVISAADGHATLFHLLGNRYTDPEFEQFYAQGKTFPSLVFVALGINRSFQAIPHSYFFELKKPLYIDPQTSTDDLLIRVHNFDPSLAPPGKTLITTMIETRNYRYWTTMQREEPERYQDEKQRIVSEIIAILEDKLGHVADLVEMQDVTTPASIIHYTNNWKGSFEGWLVTPETGFKQLPNTLPGLSHFYMCGQWVAIGGGLPTVMMSGRNVAQMICKKEGKTFEIAKPALQH